MSFTADISKFIKKAKGQEEVVIRKIGLELFTKVVMKSPVDTGRFRGNWNLSINTVNDATSEIVDKLPYGSAPGATVYGKAESNVNRWKLSDNSIYIANGLPYAERLEFGYSKQASGGMARLSVMEIAGKYR